jgi:translocation and assembly module TamA
VSTVAAKRAWGSTQIERSLTFEFLNEVKTVTGLDTSTSKSLPLTYGITLRRLDNLLFPSQGYVLNAQLGGALLPLLTDEKFIRASTKFVYYQPLGKDAKLILRGEAGALGSKEKIGVPSVYLFRAGGDQSVRGYGFQELGVQEGDATVGGRYLATGGAELQYWLTPTWGAATFYDAGNAADKLQDLHPKSGYGIGARYNSPVGPINVDLAYGHAVQKYRLHFSLGFTF